MRSLLCKNKSQCLGWAYLASSSYRVASICMPHAKSSQGPLLVDIEIPREKETNEKYGIIEERIKAIEGHGVNGLDVLDMSLVSDAIILLTSKYLTLKSMGV